MLQAGAGEAGEVIIDSREDLEEKRREQAALEEPLGDATKDERRDCCREREAKAVDARATGDRKPSIADCSSKQKAKDRREGQRGRRRRLSEETWGDGAAVHTPRPRSSATVERQGLDSTAVKKLARRASRASLCMMCVCTLYCPRRVLKRQQTRRQPSTAIRGGQPTSNQDSHTRYTAGLPNNAEEMPKSSKPLYCCCWPLVSVCCMPVSAQPLSGPAAGSGALSASLGKQTPQKSDEIQNQCKLLLN